MEEGKEGDLKQDGKQYSELWKNMVYEFEAGMTDFGEDWMSKDVVIY